MESKDFSVGIIFARLQPFHQGHAKLFEFALNRFDKVVVVIGSANQARNIKNPFTEIERLRLLHSIFAQEVLDNRLTVLTQCDWIHNDGRWVEDVLTQIGRLYETDISLSAYAYGKSRFTNFSIVGHEKDAKLYAELFPQFPFVTVPAGDTHLVNATAIRQMFFSDNDPRIIYGLPSQTIDFLQSFKDNNSSTYRRLREELLFITQYNRKWENTPFPVIFQAADVILLRDRKVLLIRRKNAPGQGLYAMPGGFVDKYERLESAAIRELFEETGIQMIGKRAGDQYSRVFDAPNRSLRGRIISHCFLYDISHWAPEDCALNPGDDAESAFWFSIDELTSDVRSQFFSDHFEIIDEMLQNHLGLPYKMEELEEEKTNGIC